MDFWDVRPCVQRYKNHMVVYGSYKYLQWVEKSETTSENASVFINFNLENIIIC